VALDPVVDQGPVVVVVDQLAPPPVVPPAPLSRSSTAGILHGFDVAADADFKVLQDLEDEKQKQVVRLLRDVKNKTKPLAGMVPEKILQIKY
jgi:hypothetical protein